MRLMVFFLCLGLAVLPVAGTRAAELYTVAGVTVDATAGNAAQARDRALTEGLQRALGQLFDRLVLSDDRAKLPMVSSQLAGSLLSSLDIVSEKSSTTRYLATLNVSFKKPAVQGLLQRLQMSYSEAGTHRLVVAPVAPSADAAPWQGVWAKLAAEGGPLDIVVPGVDDPDWPVLSSGMPTVSPDFAARYHADRTVYAVLTATGEPGAYHLELEPDQVSIDFFADPGGQETAFATAARAALMQLADQIKRGSLVDLSLRSELSVAAPLSGFDDWVRLQERLRQVPGLQQLSLRSITTRLAQIDIVFLGQPEQFARLCAQAGLTLQQSGDGQQAGSGWTVRLAGK